MGNGESTTNNHTYRGHHDFRNSAMPIRLPMPDPVELERRFTKVLVSAVSEASVNILPLYMYTTVQLYVYKINELKDRFL